MLTDPEFLAAVKKRNLLFDPGTGDDMDAITRETMSLPTSTVSAVQKLLHD
jgi:hypothetical protein